MDILVFGGTTEGSALARWLEEEGWRVTLCVATEYGACLAPEGVSVRAGRLDRGEMAALMGEKPFALVVDATHPYAVAVTENIRAAARDQGLPYVRLLRESQEAENCIFVKSLDQAARRLETLPGNVLLTTGAKELEPFAAPGLRERCCPRVLPTVSSLERCLALGFPPSHVICMQGPFTREMNVATIRQYDVKHMVTKASGTYGGFAEKVNAARETGCTLLVVERPAGEEGLDLEGVKRVCGRAKG